MHTRLALAAATAVLGTAGVAAAATAFTAHGDAGQEVQSPAVASRAQSQATFKLDEAGDALAYKLNASRIDGVRAAHVHLGAAGANGPIVAFLLPAQKPSTGAVSGRLAQGTITEDDLVGPLAGKPLGALVAELEAGRAYTNIHTDDFPGGEVRGQVR